MPLIIDQQPVERSLSWSQKTSGNEASVIQWYSRWSIWNCRG